MSNCKAVSGMGMLWLNTELRACTMCLLFAIFCHSTECLYLFFRKINYLSLDESKRQQQLKRTMCFRTPDATYTYRYDYWAIQQQQLQFIKWKKVPKRKRTVLKKTNDSIIQPRCYEHVLINTNFSLFTQSYSSFFLRSDLFKYFMFTCVHETFTRFSFRKAKRKDARERERERARIWRIATRVMKKNPHGRKCGTCMKNEQILYKHWNKNMVYNKIVVPWGVFNVDVHQFITMLHNGTMHGMHFCRTYAECWSNAEGMDWIWQQSASA